MRVGGLSFGGVFVDEIEFWRVIDDACGADRDDPDAWGERLTLVLRKLPPDEIVAWDRRFDDLTDAAYRWDLWAAAEVINGGASDDGFYYFCCWLVGMGRAVYEAALADPDTLADVVDPAQDYHEAECYYAARQAWEDVTGLKPDQFPAAPRPRKSLEPAGDRRVIDDDDEGRRVLPRLHAVYSDPEA